MKCKFGYTYQSPSKREGGSKLGVGWELKYYEELNSNGLELYSSNKIKAEHELYNVIKLIDSVEFEQDSKEIFYIKPDKRNLLTKKFIMTLFNNDFVIS